MKTKAIEGNFIIYGNGFYMQKEGRQNLDKLV